MFDRKDFVLKAIAAEEEKAHGDERTGLQILRRALSAPARQIAENSAVDGGVVVDRMLEGKGNFGFDAGRNEYVDLVKAGIVDPTKVVRIALENAVLDQLVVELPVCQRLFGRGLLGDDQIVLPVDLVDPDRVCARAAHEQHRLESHP